MGGWGRAWRVVAMALLSAPVADGRAAGRHQSGRLAASVGAGDAAVHAGRVHRVRAARRRAASRSASGSCPRRRASAPRSSSTPRAAAARGRASRSTIRAPASRSKFTYEHRRTIRRATRFAPSCRMPVPEGGIGRVLIYKTYKDPRTYMMNGDDIVWVRSLSGYRLGVRAAEGIRVHLVERRGAADDDGRWPAEAGVRESERPEQSRDDPRAQDDGAVPAVAVRPTCSSTTSRRSTTSASRRRARSRSSRPTATIARATQAKLDSLAYLALQDLKVDRSRHGEAADAREGRQRTRSSSSTCRSSTTSRARTSRSPAR